MNRHTRLVKRNTTYYIRARIPASLVYLTKSVQFNYSLWTHNYYEALARVRKDSYKIDMKINLLSSIDMKIRNKELILDDTDIDKLVIHKLKTVEKLFEDHYDEAEKPVDFALIAVIIITDFYFLEKACETIQTGTVYAIFSAIGTIFTALTDTFLFHVEFTFAKGFFIALLIAGVILIITGVVGLKMIS